MIEELTSPFIPLMTIYVQIVRLCGFAQEIYETAMYVIYQ